MEQKKFLIIGAGLAGTTLAHELLKARQQVTLVDKGENHATAIAAGMVNPMVFRRMNKSWRLDECMQDAVPYYLKLEEKFQKQLYFPITIRRMFSSLQEREFWEKRQEIDEFKSYLNTINEADNNYSEAINEFGSGRLNQAFWVDALAYYEGNRNYFQSIDCLLDEEFDLAQFDEKTASYKGVEYDKVVFCCGYLNKYIPFFAEAPVEQTKGQTVTIESTDLPEDESLNRKCFVLPLGNHIFRIGATYEWNDESLTTSESSKDLLLEHLSVLGDFPLKILDQSVGVRPTVLDRRPIMGQHPELNKLFIFNGLGTKGYLMAPTLAKDMRAFLLEGKEMDKEVSLERFWGR
ncbi:MAG: FAD-binding oxidoreductase [Flavobacteriales bacterium]|nr:FAD-binding oxidoreductase [Crocinitomicaceae bacterium]NBX81435.1 FAD-binding oxidoreductase [Flavobacteriales bacterium]NCA21738.1 FAD-binding oxidoreductase [Crocinitomicaceae bacterium]